jgi:hypothetical protein
MTGPRARELAHHWEEARRGDTNFTAALFRLVAKADTENRENLRAGFPEEVAWLETWQAIPAGERWIQAHLDGRLDHNDYEAFAAAASSRIHEASR